MTLRYEDKEYVLDKVVSKIDESTATPKEIASYKKHYDYAMKVTFIMVATMVLELQKFYKDNWSYEMGLDLTEKFQKRSRQEKYEVIKASMACKSKEEESVYNHVHRMQRYVERLERLNVNFDKESTIDIVLNSLPSCYD